MATNVTNVSQLINAIKKIGGEIYLASGVYEISTPVTTSRACKLRGPADRSAILKIKPGMSWALYAYMFRFNTTGACSFESLEFAGDPMTAKGTGYQGFVRVVGATEVLVDRCYAHDNGSDAFRFDGVDNITVTNNIADHCGHEFIYMMYDCGYVRGDPADRIRIDIHDNNIETYCNSAFRLSNGAYNAKIYDNEIHSLFEGGSTGPGIEVDDGQGDVEFVNIEICNNKFYNLNGSGVWLLDRGSTVKNVRVHDNTFRKVGQYITRGTVYTATYNGYSNAGIAICGFNGVLIYNNTFEDLKYAVIQHEFKATLDFKYVANFNNNTIDGSVVGFRLDSTRGSIVGSGNKISNVKTVSMGFTGNLKLTEGSSPIESTTGPLEKVTAIVTVSDATGRTGTQTLVMDSEQYPVRSVDTTLVTVKATVNGRYGSKNVEIPISGEGISVVESTNCTGDDLLVKVKILRASGASGELQFLLETIEAEGYNVIKYRTPEGLYGAGELNIVLEEPVPEPEPEVPAEEPAGIKSSIHTLIIEKDGVKIVHATYNDTVLSSLDLKEGDVLDVTTKFKTDTNFYGDYVGKITLRKV